MKQFLLNFKVKFLIFLGILGPGIITAIADNDAGGVATYTVAASLYGLASRFLLPFETFLLAITQEIGARIAMVTRKGLGDLIRERYGVRISLLIFILYFVTNQGVVLQNISGLKAALSLFNFPWQISLVLVSLGLIFVVIKFNYRQLQKLFFFIIFFYCSYIFSAILVKPDWREVLTEVFLLPEKINLFDFGFWFSRLAVIGTTITAWGQFFVHSYIIDKKLTVEHLKHERLEIYLGAFLTNFFSLMMVVAVAFTLFHHQIKVENVYEAALSMRPFAGDLAVGLYTLGLFAASLLGLTIVPLATAYVFSEMFGSEGSLDTNFSKGKVFYSFFILQIVIGLFFALFPSTNLFHLTLYADYLNALMLPLIFFFLIRFSEDQEIMGEYVSRGITSISVRLGAVFLTIAVGVTLLGKILRLY